MAIHIWCPRPSDSALAVRDGIRAAGVDCTKSLSGSRRVRVRSGDLVVNWGAPYRGELPAGVRVLNGATMLNKRTQLMRLYQEGVPVPEVYTGPGPGRIGRSLNHVEGLDLLNDTGRDYWTQKLSLDYELRVHVFRGRSIRAGLKVPRTNNPHQWIRSWTGGWKIDYSRAKGVISDRVREVAKSAVQALRLDFGAVDVGLVHGRAPRRPVVLEVNLAPGVDPGPSVDAYVRHILTFYRGEQ